MTVMAETKQEQVLEAVERARAEKDRAEKAFADALVSAHQAGCTQDAIAIRAGISQVAVHKRLKRLTS